MAGQKTWAVGEEALAADFNNYVQSQVVAQYPNTAARTATPVRGSASYIGSGDANEGIEFYNGTAWRRPWNLPWGWIASGIGSADQIGFSSTFIDVTGLTITFNAVANRHYNVFFSAPIRQVGVAGSPLFQLFDGTTGVIIAGGAYNAAETKMVSAQVPMAWPAGSRTIKVQGKTTAGTMDVLGALYFPTRMSIVDDGPYTGAPT